MNAVGQGGVSSEVLGDLLARGFWIATLEQDGVALVAGPDPEVAQRVGLRLSRGVVGDRGVGRHVAQVRNREGQHDRGRRRVQREVVELFAVVGGLHLGQACGRSDRVRVVGLPDVGDRRVEEQLRGDERTLVVCELRAVCLDQLHADELGLVEQGLRATLQAGVVVTCEAHHGVELGDGLGLGGVPEGVVASTALGDEVVSLREVGDLRDVVGRGADVDVGLAVHLERA